MSRAAFPLRVLLAALCLAVPLDFAPPAHAQAAREYAFVVLLGADTFAVENVTRTADRLNGELTGLALGRLLYSVQLGPAGTMLELRMQSWLSGTAADAPPVQQALFRVEGDSVIAVVAGRSGQQTQRLASQADALLYVNPSFALMEQLLLRAHAVGGQRVQLPVFMVQAGQTMAATVMWTAGDSAIVALPGSEMRAALDADGNALGMVVPAQNLTIRRVDGRHVRPLTPEPPDYSAPDGAPYRAESVEVSTPAGHTLAGTLTLPRGDGRVPAVVTITGSGAQDRDQAIPMVPGYRPFREVADTLGRRGIAVLRLDDRGFGASGGDFAAATSVNFAEDVAAAVAFLRARPDIDGSRIALLGHSEGGMVAPMVAAQDTTLAGIVLIAGPSRTGRDIIEHQQRFALENTPGIPEASRDSLLAVARAQLDVQAARQPWLRYFLQHDPLTVAPHVRRTPVLILHGETDRQIPAEQAEQLGYAFRRAGNPDVTVHTFEDVNHLMLHDADGTPAGYTHLPDTNVARAVLGTLADWLDARLRSQRQLPPTP